MSGEWKVVDEPWETTLSRQGSEEAYLLLCEVLASLPSGFRLPAKLLQPTQPTQASSQVSEQQKMEFAEEQTKQAYLWLRDTLAQAITRLIDRDMNQLMQILYRVDVAESHVQQAFQAPFREIPHLLAERILARQLQKILYQRQHTTTSEAS